MVDAPENNGYHPVMEDDALTQRVRRIYAAVNATVERDMSKLPGRVEKSGKMTSVTQDFSGDLTDEDMSNLAHMLIYSIANLEAYLKKWARDNGKDESLVDKTFKDSFEIRVTRDLSNYEKHAYADRKGGHSGRAPKLVNPRRILRLTTGAEKGSGVMLTFGRDGQPVIRGSGSAKAIVTGEVVDSKGEHIGDLYDIAAKALADWEVLLSEYGVTVGEASG